MCPVCKGFTKSPKIEFHRLGLHHVLIPDPIVVAKRNALIGQANGSCDHPEAISGWGRGGLPKENWDAAA